MTAVSATAVPRTESVILIVDDIESNRQTLESALDFPEWQLHYATDGATALKKVAELLPDLILLDVMMPGMDGFEVCSRLRNDPQFAEIPIVMVTSIDERASRLRGIDSGADDFVTKPFDRAELRARVRTITRLNRFRRLHEQRKQFQWVVENARDGYVLVNDADEILFVNACARLWLGLPSDRGGCTREKFLAAASRTFSRHPDEFWRGWPDVSAATSSSGLLVRSETPEAAAFFLEVSIHENTGGRLLWLRDVTDRLATRRDQRAFQTMVAHKLRTPLNGLYGSLQVLAEATDLAVEDVSEFAVMAREGAARLVDAVDDVLRYTELSKSPAHGEAFALAGLEELTRRVAAELGIRTISVSVSAEANAASIACAAGAMECVLFELLENSRKFHPHGSPEVCVAASLTGGDTIHMTIGDNGRTLLPEQLTRAGTPFFQGEREFTGEVPGMGLGLASVFVLVWQVGGSCCLSNQPEGPGVCVELKWPRVVGCAESCSETDGSPARTGLQGQLT
jgi:DNA-binding response OmpR family regulator